MALALACKGDGSGAQPANKAAAALPAAVTTPAAIDQAGVSHIGDTLVIALDSGSVRRVNKPEDGDSHAEYRYVGRVGRGPGTLHVIERKGWEDASVELINARTGAVALLRALPVMSPDATRFTVVVDLGMGTWDRVTTCFGQSEVTVWRMTDSVPVKEFAVDAFDCNTGRGWGPSAPVWRSADTISFMRKTFSRDPAARVKGAVDSSRATLVREPSGWVLDQASTALLPVRRNDSPAALRLAVIRDVVLAV
jgi:hypothetical protein